MGADGDGKATAILLRPAEGAESGGQWRVGVHPGYRTGCGTCGGDGFYSADGRGGPRDGTRCFDPECGGLCGDDASGCEGDRTGAIFAHMSGRCADGGCSAERVGLQLDGEGIPREFWSSGGEWSGRDEGQDVPHRAL